MRQTFEVVDEVVAETPEGVDLLAARLLDLPRAIAGRVVAQAVYGCGVPCARADVLAVLDLAAGRPGRRPGSLFRLEGAARPGVCSTLSSFPRDGEADRPRPGKGKA